MGGRSLLFARPSYAYNIYTAAAAEVSMQTDNKRDFPSSTRQFNPLTSKDAAGEHSVRQVAVLAHEHPQLAEHVADFFHALHAASKSPSVGWWATVPPRSSGGGRGGGGSVSGSSGKAGSGSGTDRRGAGKRGGTPCGGHGAKTPLPREITLAPSLGDTIMLLVTRRGCTGKSFHRCVR